MQVTVANYSQYLEATNYRPKDNHNWLRNWWPNSSLPDDGSAAGLAAALTPPPPELLDVPVTYLGLGA